MPPRVAATTLVRERPSAPLDANCDLIQQLAAMACYVLRDSLGRPVGHLCGDFEPHCPCGSGAPGDQLCDYPADGGGTCDAVICPMCSMHVSEDIDYCRLHSLGNVVPISGRR